MYTNHPARIFASLLLVNRYYRGKKLFNIMFSTYFLQLTGVLILIFVCLVIEKLKKVPLIHKKKVCVVVIMFFPKLCCRCSVVDGYSDNTDNN